MEDTVVVDTVVECAALRRARALLLWAPCAPAYVRGRLSALLERTDLLPGARAQIAAFQRGLNGISAAPTWAVPFPVIAGPGAPTGPHGGVLSAVAADPSVPPPRGASPADRAMNTQSLRALVAGDLRDLFVMGLPTDDAALVLGRSGTAAAWLALRARETGRAFPADLVVSADLVPGPGGEARLAPVEGGDLKAAIVARERPGARLLLCGACADASHVFRLEAGASVRDLERLVWGNAAVIDRAEVSRAAAAGRDAFDSHDYAGARPRYEEVVRIARPEDAELAYEACLRLAAIDIHRGRAEDANGWFQRADLLALSNTKRGRYTVERLTALAGMHIDAFQPASARALLDHVHARRAREPEHGDAWEQIQVLGAWRRLLLLEGEAEEARTVQRVLVPITEGPERPRALLDLGWTAIRCEDLEEAREALRAAASLLARLPAIYRLQSLGFLTWYAARLALRGGDLGDLRQLLTPAALSALLTEPTLQAAPRWRTAAVQAVLCGSLDDLESLSAACTPFQRWHLGVFLLDHPPAWAQAVAALRSAGLDLSGSPQLEAALAQLSAEQAADAARVLRSFVAY